MKSPSAWMSTLPPSFVATVPATSVSAPSPPLSLPIRSPVTSLRGPDVVGAPSTGESMTNVVLPTAEFVETKVSSPATGTSLTQVTVTATVAVSPPVTVYVKSSVVVPGGLLQKFASGWYVRPDWAPGLPPVSTTVPCSGSLADTMTGVPLSTSPSLASTSSAEASASSATVNASSSAVARSSTQVTVTVTVVVDPPGASV